MSRRSVIKIILPQLVAESDERALTIIKKEAVALGRLNERVPPTPFVVRLLDTGSVRVSLARSPAAAAVHRARVRARRAGRHDARRARRIFAQGHRLLRSIRSAPRGCIRGLAKGLDEIHAVGVVHRDLSPGNVLCCGSGETEMFKISDFGIARPAGLSVTFGNMLVGTPGYLAPEQIVSQGERSRPHRHLQLRRHRLLRAHGRSAVQRALAGGSADRSRALPSAAACSTRRPCLMSCASATPRARPSIWRSRAPPRSIPSCARRAPSASPIASCPGSSRARRGPAGAGFPAWIRCARARW